MGKPARKPKPRGPRPPLARDPGRPPDPLRGAAWRWTRALALWVPDDAPRAKGNHRIAIKNKWTGKTFTKGSAEEEAHAAALRAALRMACARVGWAPARGACRLDLRIDLPLPDLSPENGPAWRARALSGDPDAGPIGHGTPDRDNLHKMLADAGKGIVWADDGQLLAGDLEKRWSTSPGWFLVVWRPLGAAREGDPPFPTPGVEGLVEAVAAGA